jgi:N-methylhydantoinase A
MTWPKVKKAPAGAAKKKALKAAFMYSRKTTFDDGKTVETPRYDRGMLMAGHEIAGPVIILQHNSTTLVPPGYRARVSDNGNIHIKSV